MKTCPKCAHTRSLDDDPAIPAYQCPSCGVVYAKVGRTMAKPVLSVHRQLPSNPSLFSRLGELCFKAMQDKPANESNSKAATDSDWMRDNLECQRWQTMHIVHCLLSLFSVGIWVFVWFLVSASNTRERNKIHRRYGVPEETNTPLTLLIIFAAFWLGGLLVYWLA